MKRVVVLAGAGHAHALVLLDWRRAPREDAELVVVSPHALAPYSGMVPGWLAGHYRFDEVVIDFAALCASAGVRRVEAELDRLDPERRLVTLSTGETIEYALLSLDVGATLRPPPGGGATVLPMRPLAALRARYDDIVDRWSHEVDAGPDRVHRVTAVGGGPAGVESLLAVLHRLRSVRPDRRVHGVIVSRDSVLLPGLSAAARRAAERALAAAGVSVELGRDGADTLAGAGDLVLWATGAEAHDWQRDPSRRGALGVDAHGFVRIDAQLRSVTHPQIYAAGDCARFEPGALPKAGVYAVRMGPVLAHNLRAALEGGQPKAYRPQRRYLVLLGTGDGRAIASRGPFGFAGAWVWRWKEHIDRSFLRRFAVAGDGASTASASPGVASSRSASLEAAGGTAPGRSCPLHYRYAPDVFANPAAPDLAGLDVLYVVGGLYGNNLALDRVLALFDREHGTKRIVFNGDFHWFDVDRDAFARIQREVLAHTALRGNVETELAARAVSAEEDNGCGCAYPDWVDEQVVERSNRILRRLREAANEDDRRTLAALPMWLRADVGDLRVGIVHGDAQSLAGWGFAQEHLREAGHRDQVRGWFDRAAVDAFASTHTCLPVFQRLHAGDRGRPRWIFNNGAAGMPNFTGDGAGLLTRIAVTPFAGPERRFGIETRGVFAEAIALDIDAAAWQARFLRQWPPGSDAYLSYFERIARGPSYALADAVRDEVG